MNPSIHLGHLPIYVMMVIAATVCVMVIAEFYPLPSNRLSPDNSLGKRLVFFGEGLIALLGSMALLLGILAIVGIGFGLFYLILLAALVMLVTIPALGIPRIHRRFDAMTSRQILLTGIIIVGACAILSFLYLVAAAITGAPLRFYGS